MNSYRFAGVVVVGWVRMRMDGPWVFRLVWGRVLGLSRSLYQRKKRVSYSLDSKNENGSGVNWVGVS